MVPEFIFELGIVRVKRSRYLQKNEITIWVLTLCPLGNVHAFLSSADFFRNHFFRKILSGIQPECQTDWIQIRPDRTSGLIWVQSVCKGYEQTAPLGKALNCILIGNIGDSLRNNLENGPYKNRENAGFIEPVYESKALAPI